MKKEKIILGIDPGTTIMGYGIIIIKGKEIGYDTNGSYTFGKMKNHTQN